ncbi:hypothetical protein RDI58_006107 [Solanum bulbocastanum]|uniref:Uncharacterized protein n=1 Tax=Solanum bulbocastanum TaxID=147425 RepID=A0AAN8U153_SOLBU
MYWYSFHYLLEYLSGILGDRESKDVHAMGSQKKNLHQQNLKVYSFMGQNGGTAVQRLQAVLNRVSEESGLLYSISPTG